MNSRIATSNSKLSAAAIAKSRLLLQKLRDRVRCADSHLFPTTVSSKIQKTLLKAFDILHEASYGPYAVPVAFLEGVLSLEPFVECIERSSNKLVSWPVVNSCEGIWRRLFGASGLQVFFSSTHLHNYALWPYSNGLRNLVKNLLAGPNPNGLPDKGIHCLLLPSLEESNIPAYALIAHEFGHVAFEQNQNILYAEWSATESQLMAKVVSQGKRRLADTFRKALWAMAEELVADCVAALTLGPSFFLSLAEMFMHHEANAWSVCIGPGFQAYPSAQFRLDCVQKKLNIDSFIKDVQGELNTLIGKSECRFVRLDYPTPALLSKEWVDVQPKGHLLEEDLYLIIDQDIDIIKAGLKSFVDSAWDLLKQRITDSNKLTTPSGIAELILRMECDLPPNIIPDSTLLGKPAGFEDVLAASALYRLSLMTSPCPTISIDKNRQSLEIEKAQRLTSKATEVIYIQHEYNEWQLGH